MAQNRVPPEVTFPYLTFRQWVFVVLTSLVILIGGTLLTDILMSGPRSFQQDAFNNAIIGGGALLNFLGTWWIFASVNRRRPQWQQSQEELHDDEQYRQGMRDRLEELRAKEELRKDGWDSYGAEALNDESIDLALELVPYVPRNGAVVPSTDGGISFDGDDWEIDVWRKGKDD